MFTAPCSEKPALVPGISAWAGLAPSLSRVAVYVLLTAITITTIVPVLWMIETSFKTQFEYLQNTWLWPTQPTLDAYIGLFQQANFGRYFVNSVVVVVTSVFSILLVGSMAAYALSRYQFGGRHLILGYFLLGQMLPVTVLIVPLFLIVRDLGMLNTYAGLALAHTAGALPLVIFLLYGFFLAIPHEIEDAARIDGASEFDIYWRIILPLGAPGLATAGIFQFLFIWNDLLLVLIIMQRDVMRTITLAVFQAVGEYGTQVPSLFAGLTVSSIPVIVVYLLFTGQFHRGITAGALKG
ncbi:MAG TPA: carbohydrate ABC transporter permease [Chloroflexota bacterium]|nr:carbohydrate ABC transporter permease [Chloroflexota bacterium]